MDCRKKLLNLVRCVKPGKVLSQGQGCAYVSPGDNKLWILLKLIKMGMSKRYLPDAADAETSGKQKASHLGTAGVCDKGRRMTQKPLEAVDLVLAILSVVLYR